MTTLIVGDVHLKDTPDGAKEMAAFAAFLRSLSSSHYQRLVVLGDLFDFWFEYNYVIFSGYFEVLRAFAELRDAGVELHLICGNHDFWAGRFLEDELGFTVHQQPYSCLMGNHRTLFAHGDGVNPEDYGYRVYKRVARSGLAIWLFGLLHPDWAMAIARKVSHGSRTMFKPDEPRLGREVKPVRNFAASVLEEGAADVVICGHTHYPVSEFIHGGYYINTGDWMFHRTYVEWDGERFRLLRHTPENEDEELARAPEERSEENIAHITDDVAGGETADPEGEGEKEP